MYVWSAFVLTLIRPFIFWPLATVFSKETLSFDNWTISLFQALWHAEKWSFKMSGATKLNAIQRMFRFMGLERGMGSMFACLNWFRCVKSLSSSFFMSSLFSLSALFQAFEQNWEYFVIFEYFENKSEKCHINRIGSFLVISFQLNAMKAAMATQNVRDEHKPRIFYDEWMIDAKWKCCIPRIGEENDMQGFQMKHGILTQSEYFS